jgi:hypothetical protein
MDDRILLLFLSTHTIPHTDTWSASIRKHFRAYFIKHLQESIAVNCKANLLRARINQEFSLRLQTFLRYLFAREAAREISSYEELVQEPIKTYLYFGRPVVLRSFFLHFTYRSCKIRSERAIEVRLQFCRG